MIRWLAEKISGQILALLLAGLTPVLGGAAIYFRHEAVTLVQQASPQILAIILVSLALGGLALFACVLYLLPSFKYIPKYQFFQHRVNGLYYCPPCRTKKPLSPLKKEISGWRCPFCKSFYKDPDYVAPEVEVIPTVHHWPKPGK